MEMGILYCTTRLFGQVFIGDYWHLVGHLRYTDESNDEGLSGEVMIGVIIGCICQVVLIFTIIIACCIHRNRKLTHTRN